MAAFPRHSTLATIALPGNGIFANRWAREATLLVAAVALLSLAAQVSFNVPFSAGRDGHLVPITGQTFGVLLIAVALGMRRGVAAVSAYLAIGLLGAPIYAEGASGMFLFSGATAGYLWGFLLTAAVVGWCADHGFDRGPWLYASLLLGNALTYAIGLPVLALWLQRHGIHANVLDIGLWPFIPGDLAKLLGAAIAVPAAWAAIGKMHPHER